ncbi:DEAD/DEAH box helicase [Megamonas hypermegale]|uniref:DEAD/DEAH box helicase n=1 Tax=Megamonas hypermegale TaxID=158847 RepID=UPI0026F06611|nr:DEAD/DEAH box helicase [Megamonas hypermegale]
MKLTYQQEYAVQKFAKQRAAALFMEMGTGKTLTAIELARLHQDRYDCLLWLAPVSTLKNAEAEIVKQGGLNKPIIYRGYESIAASDRIYTELLDQLKDKRIFLVCDESLFLKNGETKRWQRTNNIRQEYAEFVVLLNGTPMSRDEMDIYWQMELLSPLILKMTEKQYRNVLFTKVTVKRHGHRKHSYYRRCQTNLAWLKSKIEPYVYECDLQLPVVLEEKEEAIRVSEYTRGLYAEAKQELLRAISSYDDYEIMAALSRMKCIVACDRQKNDAIAKAIADRHVLVFCEYREELNRIVAKTKNGVFAIDGDTPIAERDQIIRDWKETDKPLVTMTACSSFGLNLQEAEGVVFASLPWDYATYTQALHRVYRTGQTSKTVEVTRYIQRIGIAKMVEECLWRKTTLAQLVREIDWRTYEKIH